MDKDSRPLVVLFGQTKDEVLTFVGRQGYLEWTWRPELFGNILMQCNGMQTVRDIAKALGRPMRLLLQVLQEAESYGIVIDSRNLAAQFHKDCANPAQFESTLSVGDVNLLHDSTLPWSAQGESFSVEHSKKGKLTSLVDLRRSCREFGSGAISQLQLAELLRCAYSKAAVPSAGDLRPLMPYLYLFDRVGAIEAGLYEYRWDIERLTRLTDQPTEDELKRAIPDEPLLENALCLLVYAADFKRVTAKYGNRGYRFTLLEAGHCAQNVYLWGAERGFGILEYGAYLDSALTSLFGANDSLSIATALIIGKPQKGRRKVCEGSKEALERISHEPAVTAGSVKNSTLLQFPEQHSSRSYAVCQYFPKKKAGPEFAWGSGANLYEARLKAMAEGLERFYSSLVKIDKIGRVTELSGQWLDPRIVAPLSKQQYALDSNLEPFDESKRWHWVKGREQKTGNPIWIPIDLVYFPIRYNKLGRKLCTYATSSGVAAHMNQEHAINSALLELIERDAFIKAWYIGLDGAVALNTERLSPGIRKYVSKFQAEGVEVAFVQLPESHGTKVIVCMLRGEKGKSTKLGIGAGADFGNLAKAAEKAFYEAEFVWLTQADDQVYIRSPKAVIAVSDHLEFYRSKSRLRQLDRWFQVPDGELAAEISSVDKYAVFTVNLYQSDRLSIVRVLEPSLVPMSFGYGLEHYSHPSFQTALGGKEYRFPAKPHCFA